MPDTLPPDLTAEVKRTADILKARFTPPEFIPGCQVKAVDDINLYATNNGWIEAVCGQHNQQRVRYKGVPSGVGTADYVDVLYFQDRRLFEVYGFGGTAAPPTAGGVFPASGEVKIGTTLYASLAAAITAASAGDLILFDGTQTITGSSLAVSKALTIQGASRETAIITSALTDTITVTAAAALRDCTVKNTATSGTGSCINIQNGCTLDNVSTTTTGAATNHYGYYVSAGVTGLLIYNPGGVVSGATNNYHLYVSTASPVLMWLYQGYLYGSSYDININAANAVVTLYDVQLAVGAISVTSGSLVGTARDIKGRDCGAVVKNTSGGAVAQYAAGYTDQAGEFKTTTTAQDSVAWHVAMTGGPSNGYIFAQNRGNATVTYTGSAPSAGDFLVTSTTGGAAQQQTTMHPAIFAVCTAAGSGGAVEVLLLCNTQFVPATNSSWIMRVDLASTSDFVAAINAGGSGGLTATNVPYDTLSAGAANVLNAASSFGNMILWNTTRSTGRLVTAINAGTSVITTVSTTDSWADNDAITIRSQTTTTGGANKFIDVDLSNSTTVPVLARVLKINMDKNDTGGAGQSLLLHPFEAMVASKQITLLNSVTNINAYRTADLALLNRRFTINWTASGSGTSNNRILMLGYFLAVP